MPNSAPLPSARPMPKIEELRVTTGPFPSSRKVHVRGQLHPELSVAMREIDLEASAGEPPVRAYDTSGLYSDPHAEIDIHKGLPELRKPWIVARGDVEFYHGREIKPEDNGLRPRRGKCGLAIRPRAPPGAARQGRRGGDPDRLRAPRDHHPRDGICRDPRKSRAREVAPRRCGRRQVVRRRDPRLCDAGICAR